MRKEREQGRGEREEVHKIYKGQGGERESEVGVWEMDRR